MSEVRVGVTPYGDMDNSQVQCAFRQGRLATNMSIGILSGHASFALSYSLLGFVVPQMFGAYRDAQEMADDATLAIPMLHSTSLVLWAFVKLAQKRVEGNHALIVTALVIWPIGLAMYCVSLLF